VGIRKWATKSLRPGDLAALAEITRGHWNPPEEQRVKRLNRRGFLKKEQNKLVTTLHGRAALLIRRLTKH
jgi:oxalate decarboxylase/phosphoglucose isomerase-like protein (cupin superfamily)